MGWCLGVTTQLGLWVESVLDIVSLCQLIIVHRSIVLYLVVLLGFVWTLPTQPSGERTLATGNSAELVIITSAAVAAFTYIGLIIANLVAATRRGPSVVLCNDEVPLASW